MLKKYLTKFTVDILPSVAATVIGAYIVNHYIVAKPGADAPAAAMSAANPKAAPVVAKAVVPSADVGNIPEAGVKAKGISEKAIFEKSAAEKSQEKSPDKSSEKPSEKSAEKPADKPAETASIPADTRRHPPASREKAVAKIAPAPVQPAAPAVAPVIAAAPNPAPPAESAPEDRRDANDLARAAIERLRGANEGSPRPQEAARVPDVPRIPEAARIPEAPRAVSAPAIRPLPPPIMVSTPERETLDSTTGPLQAKPPYAAAAGKDDPRRPTPPAEIPSPPLDLRAEPPAEPSAQGRTNVAEEVLSAAKSVFHSVLPR